MASEDGTGSPALFQRPYPVLSILFLIYVCNTIDRNAIAFLAEPIRRDLHLGDTQVGVLTGLAFAFFYAIFGIPAGWLADRVGRVLTISIGCLVWSVCSMSGALAGGFASLAIARAGVAIGEAGGTAPSYSLIAQLFPPERRGHAFGLYHTAAPLSAFIGVALSAWVASRFGWRIALVCVSVPGLLAAACLLGLVREPHREGHEGVEAPSLKRSLADFFRQPVLRLCFVFAGLTSFTSHALIAWLPAYMMRVKGMSLLEISAFYSVSFAASFGLGLWLGGYLSDRLARRTPMAYALVPAASLALAIPFTVAAVLAPAWVASLGLWTVPLCMSGMFLAPAVTIVQRYSAPGQAAVFGAIYLLANNLVGGGLGPLYVGAVSDGLRSSQGTNALSTGLLALIPVMAMAIGGQMLIAREIRRGAERYARIA